MAVMKIDKNVISIEKLICFTKTPHTQARPLRLVTTDILYFNIRPPSPQQDSFHMYLVNIFYFQKCRPKSVADIYISSRVLSPDRAI